MSTLLLSIITYMLVGYLTGLIIGFTAFDPNTDIYALLGAVLAVVGVITGLVPLFRKWVNTAYGILLGFYLGMVITTLIWGNPQTDDLPEFLTGDGFRILVALVVAGISGLAASRLMSNRSHLPALALLLGGFIGGALFTMLGAASSSMVGLFPYVTGSGLVCALTIWLVRRKWVNTVH